MKLFFKIAISSLLLFLSITFSACKKKNKEQYIPYVYVDFYVSPSNPQFVALGSPGGWAYVTGGSRGIIIYCSANNEYAAFDRHCPYLPENSCGLVEVSKSNIMAVDSCCGSEFLLTDGSVLKSPSKYPLLRYQTTFDGSQIHVYN